MAESVLLKRKKKASEIATDEVYVIYGAAGSGKTVLASTFPKSKEAPMLYLDILEGGTGSISPEHLDMIDVVQIENFEELDEIFTDLLNGYSIDENGEQVPIKYSTIVIDSLTQMEYILQRHLMKASGKSSMTLQLWGFNKQSQEDIYNTLKFLHQKTGAKIVGIAHEKEDRKDDDNSGFNKLIPSIQTTASYSLCAKASYVWYTKVESEEVIDNNNNVVSKRNYMVTIDAHPYLLSKCRKPKDFKIHEKVPNLTYDMFKKNVLDKLKTTPSKPSKAASKEA